MMLKWRHAMRAAGLGVAFYACSGVATGQAADMPSFGGDPTPQTKVEFGTGWYIRGDAAWAFEKDPVLSPDAGYSSTQIKNNWSADLGAGYKFNNWFRGDLTLGLFGSQPISVGGAPYTGSTPYVTGGELKKYVLLLNGYVDLGTWYGITPFVGVGVGGADIINSVNVVSTSASAFTASNQKYNFAWALMAGAAYNLSENATVELGYRYVNLGNSAGGTSFSGVASSKNLSAQEIRLGVRYLVDGM
jgi:opacity protein-like surface antigen